jgi:SAM-dependent methyltransferase
MLEASRIREYWAERAQRQGRGTVGFANAPSRVQDRHHRKRSRLISRLCPRDLPTLDFGCGVGRYAPEFADYTGVDITPELLDIARSDHPGKNFLRLDEPWLPASGIPPVGLFFSATVLQHNSDDVVDRILQSLQPYAMPGITFCLYENAQIVTGHVKARQPAGYAQFVDKYFPVARHRSKCHRIHGERHCVVVIETIGAPGLSGRANTRSG